MNLVSPWKYFTVLTRSSRVASSSHTKTVCGCCWNADTVHMWLTPSSIALYKANALCAPVMRIMTWEEMKKWGNVSCGLCNGAKRNLQLVLLFFFGVSGHSTKLLTSFASMTVPTPTVSAMVGTFERSPLKNRALAIIVSFARVFTLVLETRLEPGSLKAMWPSGPIPDRTGGVVLNFTSTMTVISTWYKRTNLKCVVGDSSLSAL